MADSPWILQPDGKLLSQPLLGYASAAMPKAGLLRIDYAASEADFHARRVSTVQLTMSAAHAREIAAALGKVADMLDPPPAGLGVETVPGTPAIRDDAIVAPTEQEIDYRIVSEADEIRLDYDFATRDQ